MTDSKPQYNREQLTETVIDMIVEAKGIGRSSVTLESTFESLGVDSLDAMEILFEVEEKMNLNIPDTAARSMRTVSDVVDGLERLLRGEEIELPEESGPTSPAPQTSSDEIAGTPANVKQD